MADTITRDELKTALDEGRDLTIVESLAPQSYEQAHLPGAINVPREQVRELAPRLLPDKDAEIVVYCANTECQSSIQTAQALEGLGYTDVKDYEAGKADWIEAGLPVETGAPAEVS
ncbi:MAG: rhodanese-like domain-containing protein [Gemmatimonadota bacterium]